MGKQKNKLLSNMWKETVMDDKYCSEYNNSVEQEIIKCDDNNVKCLWLLSLILLMKDDSRFCSETERL